MPWMLNAARFVFWTMPAHNTVKTALLQRVNEVTQQDWQDIHKDVPPGSLKYAIPNGKGGWIDLARYTPTGAFTEAAGGGGYQTFTSQILPQIGGAAGGLGGPRPVRPGAQGAEDAGEPDGEGEPDRGRVELRDRGAWCRMSLRLGGCGRAAGPRIPTSTLIDPQVKPGTTGQMSAVRRTFDPLRPTYLRAPTGGASSQAAPTGAAARAVRRAQRHASRGASDASVERALRRARRAAGGG
jgi:hypothetical protein